MMLARPEKRPIAGASIGLQATLFLLECAQVAQPNQEKAISNKVFVGNLSYEVTREELLTAFGAAGKVVDAKIPTDRETGRPRGFAFVEFEESEAAEKSIDLLNGTQLHGRPLRVNLAENRPPRPPGEGGGGFRGDFAPREPRPPRPMGPRTFGAPPPFVSDAPDHTPRGFAGKRRGAAAGGRKDFEKRKRDEAGRTFDRRRVHDDKDDYDE